ncbi:hypothetical protein FWG95_04770, partial [Candidatus Saccharibacteria bacterium]|nr:hypothetical protein [Candidatus Saccharibacteria bacterium]
MHRWFHFRSTKRRAGVPSVATDNLYLNTKGRGARQPHQGRRTFVIVVAVIGLLISTSAILFGSAPTAQAADAIIVDSCKKSVSGTDQQARCEAQLTALCSESRLGAYFKGYEAAGVPYNRAVPTVEACVQGVHSGVPRSVNGVAEMTYERDDRNVSVGPPFFKITQASVCNAISVAAKSNNDKVKSDCFAAMGSGNLNLDGEIKFDSTSADNKTISVTILKGTLGRLGVAIGASATAPPAPPPAPVVPGEAACNSKYTADVSTEHYGFPDEKATRDELRNGCKEGAKNADDLLYCVTAFGLRIVHPNVRWLVIDACMYGQQQINSSAGPAASKQACVDLGGTVEYAPYTSEGSVPGQNWSCENSMGPCLLEGGTWVTGDDPHGLTGTCDLGEGGGTYTSCAITGIGWLLCPILDFLGEVADHTFSLLEGFLQVQP